MFKLLTISMLLFGFSIHAQVVGHPGGGVDVLINNSNSGMSKEQWLCFMQSSKTKVLEGDFLKAWGRNYVTESDTFNLLDMILIGVTFKELGFYISPPAPQQYGCETPAESNVFDLKKRKDHDKELALLKDILKIWEEGVKGIQDKNNCETNFGPRKKYVDHLKKIIKLYEESP
jgi:hypothetical protein